MKSALGVCDHLQWSNRTLNTLSLGRQTESNRMNVNNKKISTLNVEGYVNKCELEEQTWTEKCFSSLKITCECFGWIRFGSIDGHRGVVRVASVRLLKWVQLALEMPQQRGRREHQIHLLAAHHSHVHRVLDLHAVLYKLLLKSS